MQCLLVPVAQARKAINRKRFLGEYERAVNSFTGRLDAVQQRVNNDKNCSYINSYIKIENLSA